MLSRLGAALVALSLIVGPAVAQSPTLLLEGQVSQPQRWTLEDVKMRGRLSGSRRRGSTAGVGLEGGPF